MHNDDRQTGRIMSRREALALLGTAGAALLAARASWVSAAEPAFACVASPEQTEGPYFVDERLNRSDIRPDPSDGSVREGFPLTLSLMVSSVAAGIKYRSNVHGPVDMQVGAQYGNFYWNEPDGHQWELLTTSYARPAG